uniref:MAM domain-containing protein n=1 Tax=Parascaris univalens TaxID=6257 RepID=A0A915B4H0_PARUN
QEVSGLVEMGTESYKAVRSREMVTGSCYAVKCTFLDSSCSWRLGKNWQRLEGNLAIDTEGEDSVTSGPFIVPIGAFFEIDVWMSEESRLIILEQAYSEENVIWTRKGLSGGNGWHRLRVPIRAFAYPTRVHLKAIIPPNNFITVSNTKLVNKDGSEIGCATDLIPIEPQHIEPQRLTAYQQIANGTESLGDVKRTAIKKAYKANSVAYSHIRPQIAHRTQRPTSTSNNDSLIRVPFSSLSSTTDSDKHYSAAYASHHSAEKTGFLTRSSVSNSLHSSIGKLSNSISTADSSSLSLAAPVRGGELITSKDSANSNSEDAITAVSISGQENTGQHLATVDRKAVNGEAISGGSTSFDANGRPFIANSGPVNFSEKAVDFGGKPVGAIRTTDNGSGFANDKPEVLTRLGSGSASLERWENVNSIGGWRLPTASARNTAFDVGKLSNITKLLSRIGGQPVLEGQLRHLARQLGFSHINGEQGLELIRRVITSKAHGSESAGKTSNGASFPVSASLEGLQPIQPVNAPRHVSLSKSQLRTLSSLLPEGLLPQGILEELPENISGELLKKFASIFSPPSTRTDSQQPFAKQNLDFVVQNANSG